MPIDIDRAITYMAEHAEAAPQYQCAKYVRLGLEAGGADLSHHPRSAKDYGPTLLRIGFSDYYYFDGVGGYPVSENKSCRIVNQCFQYEPKKGDVVVIQPFEGGSRDGHIAIYTGVEWISDFRQRDMWGGPGYREHTPPFMIYRP